MCLYHPRMGRRKKTSRNIFLFLGALNGQFEIFALQKVRFCRHMGRCGNRLPTLEQFIVYSGPGLWVSYGANDASQTTALNGKGYTFRLGGAGTNMSDTGGIILYEIIELENYHSWN